MNLPAIPSDDDIFTPLKPTCFQTIQHPISSIRYSLK
jgi:hypothetical protein